MLRKRERERERVKNGIEEFFTALFLHAHSSFIPGMDPAQLLSAIASSCVEGPAQLAVCLSLMLSLALPST